MASASIALFLPVVRAVSISTRAHLPSPSASAAGYSAAIVLPMPVGACAKSRFLSRMATYTFAANVR